MSWGPSAVAPDVARDSVAEARRRTRCTVRLLRDAFGAPAVSGRSRRASGARSIVLGARPRRLHRLDPSRGGASS